MSVTRSFDFNAGTDGATITATGIINGVTGTPTYATVAARHGARGMYTGAAATTSDFIRWPRAVADNHSVSFYWTPLSISSSATAIWRAADSTNAVIAALRYRQSDSKWDIGNSNQTVNFLSTQTFTIGHQYRINVRCNFADVLNPVFTVDIYDPDETDASQTPYATFGGIIPTVLTYDRDLLGRIGTSTGTRDCYFDTLKVADNFLEIIQAEVPIPVYTPFDYTVTTGDNDGSWNKVGTFSKTGSSLLVGDPSPSDYDRSIYVRVEGVPYTRASTINEAHLTMTGLGLDTPAPNPVRIYGILSPNPDVPANNTDIRSRPRSVAYVDWAHTVNADSTAYNTPDIKTIVQELVNQTAWVPGNAMMFTLEDTVDGDVDGALSFYSYNNTPAKAPQFHSQYTPAAPDTTPALLLMMGGNQSASGFTVSCKSLRATTAAIEVSVNADMSSSTTGSTVTPSVPTITASWVPAGYAILASGLSQLIDVTAAPEGDWMYAFVVLDTNQTAVTMTGWTLRKEGDESTFTHYAVFRRKKLATDTTFTVSWPTSAKGEIGLIAYSGLDAVTPDELVATNLHTAGTGYATPTLTPNNTTRWAAAFSWSRTSTSGNKAITWTPDAGMTERLDLNNSASPSTSPWTGIQIADTNGAVTLAAHTYTAVQAFTETHGGSVMLFLIPDSRGWCKPVITGLAAATQYYYRIKLDGVRQTNLEGEIQTMPTPGVAANFTFVTTSCANTNSNHRIFDSIRTAHGAYGKPLFFLHNGDFHYIYSSGGSAPNLGPVRRQEFENVLNNAPRQHELYRKLAFYYGNSDVDGCGSNCDGTYPGWPAFGSAYRTVFPHPTLPDSGGSAVYFSFPVGRCLVIRTDHRRYSSAKAATDDASKTNLGAEQEAWLIGQLTDATYPIKIWIHENKWVGNPVTDGNTDNWQTYSTIRQRIADVITGNNIKVYYIHGDSHSFAADNGNYNPYGAFPYVVSAPMDKDAQVWTPPTTNGRYPDTALAASQGYGIFDVKDTGSAVTITFAGKTIYPDVPPPPIGAHSFNEPSGAVVDDTGNGHGFALAAGLSRPTGKFGTGLTTSVSTVDGPPAAYGETSARTLMMWLKSTATFNGGIYEWHDNTSGLGRWGLKCNFADMIGFEATDSAGTAQFASIPRPTDGLWHHYAGAWDGTLVRLYKDGVLQSPQTAPALTLATLGTSRTGGCAQVRVFTDTGSPTLIDYFQVQEGVNSITLNPPLGILAGDKVIIWSANKLSAAIPTDPEPWNFLGMGVVGGGADGVGTGAMRIGVWEKVITDPLADIVIDVPGAINVMGSGVVYRPPSGVAWQPSLLLFGSDISAGLSFSAQVSAVGGYAVGDYCLSIGVLDDTDPLLGRGVQMPGVSGFGSGINSSGSTIGNHMFMFTDHLQVTAQALSGGIAADADVIRIFSNLSAGQTIDDVRVYNLALDTNTIQTLMDTPGTTPPAPAMAPRVVMGYTWSTLVGATIRVADGVGGTIPATFKGFVDTDGSTILPATLRGWWDGSAIQPLT